MRRGARRLRIDEERARAFGAFVWRRFLADNCLESAGALSYTTLFALVPLVVAAFGLLSAFAFFEGWVESVTGWIFQNFVPSSGVVVQEYLTGFADNATKLTGLGVAGVLISAVMMMWSVEEAYNRIWRVPKSRSGLSRFKTYWTTLTLGPLLTVGVVAVTSYLWTLPAVRTASAWYGIGKFLLVLAPLVVLWGAITASYLLIPHARVRFRHAAIGGLVATVLFNIAQGVFSVYLGSATTYQQIYGALAALPLFLVWIYLTWVIVLLGASFAASLSSWRFQPRALRVPPGLEFFAMLKSLRAVIDADRGGETLNRCALLAQQPGLTDEQLNHALEHLKAQRVVHVNEKQDISQLREPDDVSLLELFEGGRYAWPTGHDLARLAALAEPADQPIADLITELHTALAPPLRQSAAGALEPEPPIATAVIGGDEAIAAPEVATSVSSGNEFPAPSAVPTSQEKA